MICLYQFSLPHRLILLLLISHDLETQILLSELHQIVDLVVVDESVAIRVGVLDTALALPATEPHSDAADGTPQLVPADAPVLVGVEALQPHLELFRRHLVVPGACCDTDGVVLDGHDRWSLCVLRVMAIFTGKTRRG
ncbi:unnamed protein product [Musa acuminata subsp. burmannicoides]